MRLIDAEKLDEELCEILRKAEYDNNCGTFYRFVSEMNDCINDQPTVDAVPVVRCKDCKHFTEGMAIGICKRIKDNPIIPVAYSCFCSWGKKMDGDKE